ncbi:hypothetical protein NLG97_g1179 [Lecanicillium saksenae]|uniref:Uncharacterized protein n=1 Tax=Lecanicillium saksenae TaxID=468837 RepID=A0ACC1R6G5_9HYPO|nr:hypothetical protein NLG97_g1179 [Lecanicillium saksenae]
MRRSIVIPLVPVHPLNTCTRPGNEVQHLRDKLRKVPVKKRKPSQTPVFRTLPGVVSSGQMMLRPCPAVSSSVDDGSQEPELLDSGAVRQKKWAPRSTGGCLTCRARRVKCDETKPLCRRCVKSGQNCRGYGLPKPAVEAPPNRAVTSEGQRGQLRERGSRQGARVSIDIDPPLWPMAEALRYSDSVPNTIDYRVYRPTVKIDIQAVHEPQIHHRDFEQVSFICMMVVKNIAYVQKHRQNVSAPRADPGLNSLWEGYFRQVQALISRIVQLIQDKNPLAFAAICLLSSFHRMLNFPTWSSHLNGYLSLMQCLGGTKAVLNESTSPFHCGCVVVVSVFNNTSSPLRQQARGIDSLTDDDMRRIYPFHPYRDVPCPIDLFLSIVHITRFRVHLASAISSDRTAVKVKVQSLLDSAYNFDPKDWAKAEGTEPGSIAMDWAHIFRVAVGLYGILTLPQAAVMSWAASTGNKSVNCRDPYRTLCNEYRCELLDLLRQNWPHIQERSHLIWPFAVAGVAAADGALLDQHFVSECLLETFAETNADPPAIVCREKLIEFWESGSLDWNDCFYEPTWSTC